MHLNGKAITKSFIGENEMALTFFYNNVTFSKTCFCTYIRSRYQASVYRTIGSLVVYARQKIIWSGVSGLTLHFRSCAFKGYKSTS